MRVPGLEELRQGVRLAATHDDPPKFQRRIFYHLDVTHFADGLVSDRGCEWFKYRLTCGRKGTGMMDGRS